MSQSNVATKPAPRRAAPAKKRPKRRKRLPLGVIILCVIFVLVIIAGAVAGAVLRQNPLLLQGLTETSPFFQSGSLGQQLLSLVTGLPLSTHDRAAFSTDETGRITYTAPGTEPLFGIDVSSYQGEIDWASVAADGVEFAIVRVAFRGYGEEGSLLPDPNYQANLEGAIAAGIPVGVYVFSQAVTEEEAIEEAQLALSLIEGYDITYPVVYDWEPFSEKTDARTLDLSAQTLTACARAFCETVKDAGYTPMVYFNHTIGLTQYHLPDLADYDFWLAQYYTSPTFYAAFQIWQYTDEGQVDGITGKVDLNMGFFDYAAN